MRAEWEKPGFNSKQIINTDIVPHLEGKTQKQNNCTFKDINLLEYATYVDAVLISPLYKLSKLLCNHKTLISHGCGQGYRVTNENI